MQSAEMIRAALNADPSATPEERKRILAALKGDDPDRRPRLVGRREAAAILSCSTKTISRYVKAGIITEIRFNSRRSRFNEAEILRLAREGVEA